MVFIVEPRMTGNEYGHNSCSSYSCQQTSVRLISADVVDLDSGAKSHGAGPNAKRPGKLIFRRLF
ncbi:MAG: hypothetical protein OXH27_02960, partial [Gammaproteobacteria bacterium]|nr:hypothetical protein [Gammaproteobacteria bacterium]